MVFLTVIDVTVVMSMFCIPSFIHFLLLIQFSVTEAAYAPDTLPVCHRANAQSQPTVYDHIHTYSQLSL